MKRNKKIAAAVGVLAALLVAVPSLAAQGRDGNDDGLPDRWERHHHLSLKVNQAPKDQDADGLRNKGEYREGTDPRDPDTDGDGAEDGEASERQGKPHPKPGDPTPPPAEEEGE